VKPVERSGVVETEDQRQDRALRPRLLAEFVGQERVVANLAVAISAARSRDEALDHLLFSGLPGLGKTTLAHLVAAEAQVGITATSGPVLERAGDLAGVLTNLGRRDILFVDEIHRLSPTVEEYLYSAMEDYCLDIVIDSGPNARSVKIPLEPFTLIGATTREGLLTRPLRDRFGILEKLDLYSVEELVAVLDRSARLLGVDLGDGSAEEIARRSRGTPRVANRYLRRVRDLAQVRGISRVEQGLTAEALDRLGVDASGLQLTDRKILEALVRNGGPVGLKTIGIAAGEEPDTIEEVYEPFLVRQGFLVRTPRGRIATEAAFALLGLPPPPLDPNP